MANPEHLKKYIEDCQARANRIIQMLKAAQESASKTKQSPVRGGQMGVFY